MGGQPKFCGAQGGPANSAISDWLRCEIRLVADRRRSWELGLSWQGVALRCYKPPAKPQGTLTSADKNLGGTSQR